MTDRWSRLPRIRWTSGLLIPLATVRAVRIAFFSLVVMELLFTFSHRGILFSPDSPVKNIALPLALVSCSAVTAGLYLRISSILAYLSLTWTLGSIATHYDFDNIIRYVAFVFLFAPTRGAYAPRWFGALMLGAIGLPYFSSVLYKLQSQAWLSGSALWLAVGIPPLSTGIFPRFLQSTWFIKLGTYVTLTFEIVFPFILLPRIKPIFTAVGLVFHLGIALFCPIPFFGLGMAALYLQFIDFGPTPKQADSEIHTWRQPGWALVAVVTLCQFVLCLEAHTSLAERTAPLYKANRSLAAITGVADHSIYKDSHFNRSNSLYRFILRDRRGKVLEELATFTEECYPRYPQTTGRLWALHGFYLSGTRGHPDNWLKDCWAPLLLRWIVSQDYNPAEVEVVMLYHPLSLTTALDFSAQETIRSKGWREAGTIHFEGEQAQGKWSESFASLFDQT